VTRFPNFGGWWEVGGEVFFQAVFGVDIGPPLRPGYIGERRTIFAKAYGMKVRCLYGDHVGEHIVNLGNILGTL